MSKSLRDAIALSATPAEVRAAVRGVYTDPLRLRPEDPGISTATSRSSISTLSTRTG
jgi:tryptophanyl-tRNA synthetase